MLVDQAAAQGKIAPTLVRRIKAKSVTLNAAVERVEKASGLAYPPYYVEPSLPVATSSVEFGSVGALFARVIPATVEGRLSIVVQFTAPLVIFGLKGTVEAVAAHEFTHYVDLVRRFSSMQLTSDERASTLFESGYADEERVVDPALVFTGDKTLASLVKRKFKGGPRRREAQREGGQGLDREGPAHARGSRPRRTRSTSASESIATASFDPMVLCKDQASSRSEPSR